MIVLEKILPCPFCGSSASIEEFSAASVDPKSAAFSVGCDSPDEENCMGYQSLTTFSRRSDAIKAWNKRATPELILAVETKDD